MNTFERVVSVTNRFLAGVPLATGLYIIGAAAIYRTSGYYGITLGIVFIALGILGFRGRLLRRPSNAQGLLICLALGVSSMITLLVAWESWRAYTLLNFCKEVRVGLPFSDLLRLERRHWIDDSFLVQARFRDFVDQAHSRDLDFRSHMLDPDFQCSITHDGSVVTTVQLLE